MTETAPAIDARLSCRERVDLDQLEARIEKGMAVFVEVGSALASIRNRRLYRGTHATFDAYLLDRWSFTRQHAGRLIAAAEVVANVTHRVPSVPPPETERQARALSAVAPDRQAEVWEEAHRQAAAEGKRLSAARVEELVGKLRAGLPLSAGSEPPGPRPKTDQKPTRQEVEAGTARVKAEAAALREREALREIHRLLAKVGKVASRVGAASRERLDGMTIAEAIAWLESVA